MIELLLEAERDLSMGLLDQAERLYRQASLADPRNAIAVVGLARVALERADDAQAYREARRALTIDPENVVASRLVTRLEEVFATRGEAVPAVEAFSAVRPAVDAPAVDAPAVDAPAVDAPAADAPAVDAPAAPMPTTRTPPAEASGRVAPATPGPVAGRGTVRPVDRRVHVGLVDRLLRRRRR
jgi:tetratricopeptide (TPR) repeat protein